MKPVSQVYDCDCVSACLASILELPLDQVPLFDTKDARGRFVGQDEAIQQWLTKRGLTMLTFPVRTSSVATCRVPWEPIRATWCIITMKYPRRRATHAVVGRAAGRKIRVVHDPYQKPDRMAAAGRPVSVSFIIPKDVSDWSLADA